MGIFQIEHFKGRVVGGLIISLDNGILQRSLFDGLVVHKDGLAAQTNPLIGGGGNADAVESRSRRYSPDERRCDKTCPADAISNLRGFVLLTMRNIHIASKISVRMVLDHGHIIERGDYEKLIAEKGTYDQLYTGAFELE